VLCGILNGTEWCAGQIAEILRLILNGTEWCAGQTAEILRLILNTLNVPRSAGEDSAQNNSSDVCKTTGCLLVYVGGLSTA
jgi:hypothetical protein